jgi:hypothetical protein
MLLLSYHLLDHLNSREKHDGGGYGGNDQNACIVSN